MLCPSDRPKELSIKQMLGDTDDEKTPEYPLSDDHPLSLHNRAKLLSAFSGSSSNSESKMQYSSQRNATPSEETASSFDFMSQKVSFTRAEIPFRVGVSQSLRSLSYNGEYSPPFGDQNTSVESADSDGLEPPTPKLPLRLSVMEALDLASERNSSLNRRDGCFSKHHAPISSLADSLIDYSSKRENVLGSSPLKDEFLNKLSSVWKRHDTQSVCQTSTRDSNNNSGGISPKTNKLIATSTSTDIGMTGAIDPVITDASKALSHNKGVYESAHSPSSTVGVGKSENIGIDIEEKNFPPHLSPVTKISLKSDAVIRSHFPYFPPTLSPVSKSTLSRNITVACSTKESETDKSLASLVQSSGKYKSSEGEGKTYNDIKVSQCEQKSAEKSLTACQSLKTSRNSRQDAWIPSHPSHTPSNALNVNRPDLETIQMESPSFTHKKLDAYSNRRGQAEKEVSLNISNQNQSHSENKSSDWPETTATSSDMQIKKSCCASSTGKRKSRKSRGSKQTSQIDSVEMGQECTAKTRATPSSVQWLPDTKVKSVIGGGSYLCYPYPHQNITDYGRAEQRDKIGSFGVTQRDETNLRGDSVEHGKVADPYMPIPPYPQTVSGSEHPSLQTSVVYLDHVNSPVLRPPSNYRLPGPLPPLPPLPPATSADLHQFVTPIPQARPSFPLRPPVPSFPPNMPYFPFSHKDLVSAKPGSLYDKHPNNPDCSNSFPTQVFDQNSPQHGINASGNQTRDLSSHHQYPNQIGAFRHMFNSGSPVSSVAMSPLMSKTYPFDTFNSAQIPHNENAFWRKNVPPPHELITKQTTNAFNSQEYAKMTQRPISEVPRNFSPTVHFSERKISPFKHDARQAYDAIANFNVNVDKIPSVSSIDTSRSSQPAAFIASHSGPANGQFEPLDLSSGSPTPQRKPSYQNYRTVSSIGDAAYAKKTQLQTISSHVFPSSGNDDSINETISGSFKSGMSNTNDSDNINHSGSNNTSSSTSSIKLTSIEEQTARDTPNDTNNNNSFVSTSTNETHVLNETGGNQHRVSNSERLQTYRPTNDFHKAYTEEISLPNERNLVIDIADDESDSSLSSGTFRQKQRKSTPDTDFLSSNPDKKSYSQLALAVITSKRKKSLESCAIPSENEDFLAFLRRDGDSMNKNGQLLREGEDVTKSIDFVSKNKLKNREFIDLTEEHEDVVSVSSDDMVEDQVSLDELENVSTVENWLPFNQESTEAGSTLSKKRASESEEYLYDETCNLSERKSIVVTNNEGTYDTVLPVGERNNPKINDCGDSTKPNTDRFEQMSPPFQDETSILSHSQLFHIKEKSLAFGREQRAVMAKRIQDIISKNNELLPENMRPHDNNMVVSSSQTCFMSDVPENFEGGQTNILKSEIPLIPSSVPDPGHFRNLQNGVPTSISGASHPMPEKVEKTLPKEIDFHNSLQTPMAYITADGNHSTNDNGRCSNNNSDVLLGDKFEGVQSGPQLHQPRSNDESTVATPSRYKTVWQSHFVTKENGGNDDGLKQLELMRRANNSINLSSRENRHKEHPSVGNTGTSKRRRRRSKVKRISQDESHPPELYPDPISKTTRPEPHPNFAHMPTHQLPSEPGQLNSFLHSTFLVAPYYAMAYPLCYPQFPNPTASDQPIHAPTHPSTFDAPGNPTNVVNKRKRTKRNKALNKGPHRKRKAKNTKKNLDSETDPIPESNSNEVPQNNPGNLLETQMSHLNEATTDDDAESNVAAAKVREVPLHTHDTRPLGLCSPGDQSNLQLHELLSSESNYTSCYMHTRNEDGLTVLSMQGAGEFQSNGSDALCNSGDGAKKSHSFKNSCRVDLDLVNPISATMHVSSPVPCDSSVEAIPSPRQSMDATQPLGQNLATLAYASEKHEKIIDPLRPGSRTETQIDSNTKLLELNKTKELLPSPTVNSLFTDLRCSPDSPCDVTPHPRSKISDETPLAHVENSPDLSPESTMNGITEKEKAVTEILATMMQNRNTMSFT